MDTMSLDFFFSGKALISARVYMCLNICQHIGGSILATTHYPKSDVPYILFVISLDFLFNGKACA